MADTDSDNNYYNDDYYIDGAIKSIETMKGRELPDLSRDGLKKHFGQIGSHRTKIIIHRLKGYDIIPQNIIGLCERLNNEIGADHREAAAWHEKNDDLFGSTEELNQIGVFNQELLTWHKIGLCASNKNGTVSNLDLEQWINAGRPKSWSPLLDHWLEGFEPAYFEDQKCAGKLLDYLIRYNRMLVSERKKRTAERQAKTSREQSIFNG